MQCASPAWPGPATCLRANSPIFGSCAAIGARSSPIELASATAWRRRWATTACGWAGSSRTCWDSTADAFSTDMRDKLELIERTLEARLSHAAVAPVPSAAGPRCGDRSLAVAG